MTANISPLFRDVNKFAVLTCGKIGNKVTNMRYGERLRTARILLLTGGDKRRQQADIASALDYWKDWQRKHK